MTDDNYPAPSSDRRRTILRLLVVVGIAFGLLFALPVAAQVVTHRSASSSAASGGVQSIGRADLHYDSEALELELALTQTENACEQALNGQTCVRYSLSTDDKPFESGFGLIPDSAVTLNAASLTVTLNAGATGFHHLIGKGGTVTVTWSWKTTPPSVTARGQTSTLIPATITGTVLGHAIPASAVTGSVLLYTSS